MRTKFMRTLPERCARTICSPSLSSTRNIALGSASVTVPSTSIASRLAICSFLGVARQNPRGADLEQTRSGRRQTAYAAAPIPRRGRTKALVQKMQPTAKYSTSRDRPQGKSPGVTTGSCKDFGSSEAEQAKEGGRGPGAGAAGWPPGWGRGGDGADRRG